MNQNINLVPEPMRVTLTRRGVKFVAYIVSEGTYGENIALSAGEGRSADEALEKAKALIVRKMKRLTIARWYKRSR